MSRSTVRLCGGPMLEDFELELGTADQGRRLIAFVPEEVQAITGWTPIMVLSTATGRWSNNIRPNIIDNIDNTNA